MTRIGDQPAEVLRFFVAASAVLAEPAPSLEEVARLAVPSLADWCTIDLPDELAAAAHVDPSHVQLLRELRRLPFAPAGPYGVARVIASGQPELVMAATDDMIAAMSADARALAALRELATVSWMTAPLSARDKTFGAITFGRVDHARAYDPSDLRLAEDVARRIASTLSHAEALKTAQRERARAEEANRAKDDFLAVVSHELRTPLNAVLGWARLLRDGSLDAAKTARAIDTIERNAKAQSQLIDDLLDVSRIITGRIRLDVRSVDPASLVAGAIDSIRPLAESKNVRLHTNIDRDCGPIVGDADRLLQVVTNLLGNAVKFTPAEGHVRVSLQRVDRTIALTVADTGAGIRPDVLPYVFDRFRQAPGAARTSGGLGLGLAIVRHLVELHGGRVQAYSEGVGRGSRFVVTLPVTSIGERTPAARAYAQGYAPPRLDGLRILVVDDQPDARELVVSLFEEAGATAITAATAEEALTRVRHETPDVIVSDLAMPIEDGYTLIRRVRELPPEEGGGTPAVALTAYSRLEDRTRALRAGFQMCLTKPAEPAELLIVVAGLALRAVSALRTVAVSRA
ncbi:MAG: response regulator [Labilithrix sp.]|nr:response regulator [Labilithrix sp.]MCW5818215.1 response regulator [Labilithrix sp.]